MDISISLPSEAELGQIRKAFGDEDIESFTIRVVSGSSWIMIDAHLHMDGYLFLALWRTTGAVHKVSRFGAVDDDPFIPGWS